MLENLRSFFTDINISRLVSPETQAAWGDGKYVLFIVVFLGILFAFEGLRQFLSRGENRSEAINRRMQLHAQGKTEEQILALLKPTQKSGILGNLPFFGDLRSALTNIGSPISPVVFLGFCLAGFVLGAAAGLKLSNPYVAVTVAAFLFLFLPQSIVSTLNKKRKARLVKQLPDALDLMSRGLSVGHPLNATLQSVAKEMADPVGTEFGIVVDQVAYGDDLTSAVNEMARRVDDQDVQYLAIAIGMQHGSGGDLAGVLGTLSRVIRARSALRRKVKAISSEGRLTAYILSSLPIIIVTIMAIRTPSYYGDVMEYSSFWPTMITIGVAVVLNAIIMFRLVNFRI